jgi:signal transduction histidine kinase
VTAGAPGSWFSTTAVIIAECLRRQSHRASRHAPAWLDGVNHLARGVKVKLAADATLEGHIKAAFERLKSLDEGRAAIDAGIVDRRHAAETFTDFIDVGFRIYGALATLDDPDVARQGRVVVALARAREVLSQEDALLSGMLGAGVFTPGELGSFIQLAGTQRFLYAETDAELPAASHARYQRLVSSPDFTAFRELEDLMTDKATDQDSPDPLPVRAGDWRAAADQVFAGLYEIERMASDATVVQARPAATAVILRLGLAGGLGLAAVIASIVISITTARSLVQRLANLRTAAWDLADERLPGVVERIRRGDEVDVAAQAPPLESGADEVGQVAEAFNAVQRTAVQVAVEQAELRRGVRDVFLSLARRTQALVHRQLAVLDAMERRETEPETLDDLFRLDHLATRMRRNAENLIVLSGAVPGRGWRRSVPVIDVIRGAVAEVEDHARVTVLPVGPAELAGRAVGDVLHLLAELLENAASFSPPETAVQVGGQRVANGFVVEIEDRGLGMRDADLAAANALMTNPPEFTLSSTARLGLYVVGRLAQRHGVKIRLRDSPYGGTTAIVLIPSKLVVGKQDADAPRAHPAGRRADPSSPAGDGPAEPTPGAEDPGPESPAGTAPWPPMLTGQGSPEQVTEPAEAAAGTGVKTPNGLPRWVRQASLAAPLREAPGPEAERGGDTHRAPEEVHRMMVSYQRGTMRGREAAERSLPLDAHPSTPASEDTRVAPGDKPTGSGTGTGTSPGDGQEEN